ncbi:MAG TPA: choice-of-anchor A family protein [Bryobacteraceae bacterium]
MSASPLCGGNVGALGAANAYNLFVFGNLSLTGADTGGRVAVGGNASFPAWYSIGQNILDSFTAPDNLDVDLSITAGPAGVYNGNAYEGVAGASYANTYNGTATVGGASPLSVANQYNSLLALSNQITQLTANSSVVLNGSTVTLTGTDPTLEVFNLPIADLGGNNAIYLNVKPTATVLINVIGSGSITTSNSGFFYNGSQIIGNSATGYDRILFNFNQATGINFGGTFEGTVLAPKANVTGTTSGQLDGGLIAQSFTGNTEFHDLLFTGTIPTPTPELQTWAMYAIGGGLVLFARTRRLQSVRSK